MIRAIEALWLSVRDVRDHMPRYSWGRSHVEMAWPRLGAQRLLFIADDESQELAMIYDNRAIMVARHQLA